MYHASPSLSPAAPTSLVPTHPSDSLPSRPLISLHTHTAPHTYPARTRTAHPERAQAHVLLSQDVDASLMETAAAERATPSQSTAAPAREIPAQRTSTVERVPAPRVPPVVTQASALQWLLARGKASHAESEDGIEIVVNHPAVAAAMWHAVDASAAPTQVPLHRRMGIASPAMAQRPLVLSAGKKREGTPAPAAPSSLTAVTAALAASTAVTAEPAVKVQWKERLAQYPQLAAFLDWLREVEEGGADGTLFTVHYAYAYILYFLYFHSQQRDEFRYSTPLIKTRLPHQPGPPLRPQDDQGIRWPRRAIRLRGRRRGIRPLPTEAAAYRPQTCRA